MIAVDVLDAVKTHCLDEVFEFSGRGSYKILVSSFSLFPDSVIGDLKSLRKTSSTFGGIRGQKVLLTQPIHLLNIFIYCTVYASWSLLNLSTCPVHCTLVQTCTLVDS